MTSSALVVPIDLEALCVGDSADPGLELLGETADFSALPKFGARGVWEGQPYIGDSITSFAKLVPQRGVHLHWALPDALTAGKTGDDGSLTFPAVPNRWLVVRLVAGQQGAASRAAWIVESDYVSAQDGEGTISIPLHRDGETQLFRYLGRAVGLKGWREGATPGETFGDLYGSPLSAIGYGETTFAAYYPNCRNVFGFHDPLQDLGGYDPGRGDRLSYVVIGWYGDPALDPLGDGAVAAERLRWSVTKGGDPRRTICCGMLQAIAWRPGERLAQRSAAPLDVVLGNSNVECVSALLASRPELASDADIEFLLNGLQMGLHPDGPRPDQVAQIEEAVHGSAFGTVSGGGQWQVGPVQAPAAAPGDTNAVSLSVAAATKLDAVNALQRAYDRTHGELTAGRRTLFLDWYRYMRVLHGTDDQGLLGALPKLKDRAERDRFAKSLRSRLQARMGRLNDLAQAAGTLAWPNTSPGGVDPASTAGQLVAALDALAATLKAEGGALAIFPGPAPRYWEPVDPVLLLAGDDVQPPRRYGGDGSWSASGELPCRLSGEIIGTLTATVPGGEVTLGAVDLAAGLDLAALPIAAEATALLAEAVLTDPAQAEAIAAMLSAKAANQPSTPFAASLPDLLAGLDRGLVAAQGLTLHGALPCPLGRKQWTGNPWLPLFLSWSVEYRATVTPALEDVAYAPDSVVAAYGLDRDHIDLVHNGELPPATQFFSGVSLLTQNAFRQLHQALGNLTDDLGEPGLKAAADKLAATPILSHVLEGFHEALLTRKRALQLDVFDPASRSEQSLFAALNEAIADGNRAAPRTLDPFHAIRAGYLRVTSLSLIDAFGRTRRLDLKAARKITARSVTPTSPGMAANDFAHLPPRLIQPSRLSFRLLQADDHTTETASHPETSPICGWVLVNNLDPGLAIYAADGSARGILRLVGDGSEAAWQPAPTAGTAVSEQGGAPDVAALARRSLDDGHLADFVVGVLTHPDKGAYLAQMLHVIDRTLETIVPDHANPDQGLALLVGRPLALVRASLSLEMQGPPAASQAWTALHGELAADRGDVLQTRDLAGVQFDVTLGDLSRIGDGLVGYFLERAGDASDYRAFFAPAATAAQSGVHPPREGRILLTCGANEPQRVTMLVDPHAVVHATSGILPVKSISIPPSHFAKALAGLQVAFPCNPVLEEAGGLRLPLPAIAGFGWRWTQARSGTWTDQPGIEAAGERSRTSYSPAQVVEGWLTLSPTAAPATPTQGSTGGGSR
jgi:hypothetical protein